MAGVVALSGCACNTWRNDKTEINRNAPAGAHRPAAAWRDDAAAPGNDEDAMTRMTDEIQRLRLATLGIVNGLR